MTTKAQFDPQPRDSSRAPTVETTKLSDANISAGGGTYLLTWTTYGSWLRGVRRGFVGRVPDASGGVVIHNQPAEPYDVDEHFSEPRTLVRAELRAG